MSTVIDETIEIAAATPAPSVLPDFAAPETPSSEKPAPEPMTQRRVLGLATPIIGENLLHTLVGAVDTFLVARLGAAAVAGVGTGFEFVFFIISILSAIDIGATVLVSQAIGAGDQRAGELPGAAGHRLGPGPGRAGLDRHVRGGAGRSSGSSAPSPMSLRRPRPTCRSSRPRAWRCSCPSSAARSCAAPATAGPRWSRR